MSDNKEKNHTQEASKQEETAQQDKQGLLEITQNKLKETEDKMKRVAATYHNEKRKWENELEEYKKYGLTNFSKRLNHAMEVLHLAFKSTKQEDLDKNKELNILYQGLSMSLKEIEKVFNDFNLKKIAPKVGDDFDFNLHSAIATAKIDNTPKGKVIELVREGLILHDRVLSPAMVKVSE